MMHDYNGLLFSHNKKIEVAAAGISSTSQLSQRWYFCGILTLTLMPKMPVALCHRILFKAGKGREDSRMVPAITVSAISS